MNFSQAAANLPLFTRIPGGCGSRSPTPPDLLSLKSTGVRVKPILPVLVAAVAVAIWSGSCEAQYGYPQVTAPAGAYRPAGHHAGFLSGYPAPSSVGYPAYPSYSPGVRMQPQIVSRMPSGVYQPRLTSMRVFQDGAVPIPNDTTVTPNHSGAPETGTVAPGSSVPAQGSEFPSGSVSGADACCGVPLMTSPALPDGTTWNAFSPPFTTDPFLAGPQVPAVPQSPTQPTVPQGLYSYGANGPAPYRFGWNNRIDLSWMPDSSFSDPALGEFGSFGVDYGLTHTSQLPSGCILNWTNQFAYRNLSGGPPAAAFNLPSSLFRFGFDIEMETQSAGPASLSFAVTPSINTDFDADPWSEGFQLDGRGIMLFRLDPYWTLGLGAMYWDRLNDRVIPWGGLIYRDDYWEWQLMFPETRVSLFLGNERLWAKWLYFRAEYHVESYGVQRENLGVLEETQLEISDYRLLGGFRMDAGFYSWFIEAGAVLDRSLEYGTSPSSTGIDSGFIGQLGLRF
ncbi:MAG: hypothetical protein RL215_359 [Planctomycetota bacterium]